MAVSTTRARVRVQPIEDPDVGEVAAFLHQHLNPRVSVGAWTRAMRPPWPSVGPNLGFHLRAGDEVVGALLAFYAEREIAERRERLCNLGAWCVRPDHRLHAARLLRAALAQEGWHFTDLSPSGSVIAINTRLGFRHLDTRTALVPNLPWPTWPGRVRVVTDLEQIARRLDGAALQRFEDHARAPAVRHVLLSGDSGTCHVLWRRVRRRGLPVFAAVVHVSDPEAFRRLARAFVRHVLVRHGIPLTLAEDRIVKHRPRPSFDVRSPRPKMYLSRSLAPEQIDDLYSELVCVPW